MGPKKKQATKPRKGDAAAAGGRSAQTKASKTASQSSRTASQSSISQSIFGRENRLDGIFSQEAESHDDDTSAEFASSKKRRAKPFEEDEGFFYKRTKGSEPASKKKVSTPVSKLNRALDDLPGTNITDEFYAMDYEDTAPVTKTSKPKTKRAAKKASPKRTRPRRDLDLEVPEVVKLSSPIRTRYEGTYNEPSSSFSSDDYVEQVSHHKVDLTGGSSDFEEMGTKPQPKSKSRAKTDRRSSYHNRGKRISSIGNGLVGLPHEDVSAEDYYKLLDSSLPEPHRMKQLLIWCITKKMSQEDKQQRKNVSTEDKTIINIAKVIKEEVLQDLRDGSVTTSWYYKPDDNDADQGIIANKEIMLPNPLNSTTAENIKHFTKQLAKLRREKDQWKDLYRRNMAAVNKKLVGFQDVKIDTNNPKDAKTVQTYCHGRSDQFGQVVDGKLISKIETTHKEVTDKFSDNIENSIDQLYNLTNKLTKVSQLIDHYKTERLNPKVAELTHNYINKSNFDEASVSDKSRSIWPIPPAKIGMKQILQGIAKIEYQAQTRPTQQPHSA